MVTLEDKIRSEVQETGWDALVKHAERGGLILVSPQLDLVVAALAVAEDRAEDITTFLEAGLLTRPNEATLAALDADDNPQFSFVIVQPFVLASRVDDGAETELLN